MFLGWLLIGRSNIFLTEKATKEDRQNLNYSIGMGVIVLFTVFTLVYFAQKYAN